MQNRVLRSPKAELTRAVTWALTSVILSDVSWSRIVSLRKAGYTVATFHYVMLGLCIAMVAVWMWIGWKSWKRYSAERKVS